LKEGDVILPNYFNKLVFLSVLTASAILCPIVSPCFAETLTKTLADGKELSWNTTNGLPDPAENEHAKIAMMQFSLDKAEGSDQFTMLSWEVGFNPKEAMIKTVKVTEIDGDREIFMLEDDNVNTESGFWGGKTTPVEISPENTPWLYTEGTTEKLFKFEFQTDKGEKSVLYQLALFPPEIKNKALFPIESGNRQ